MDTIVTLLKEYGIYIALPIIIAGVTQGLKKSFKKFFKMHHIGMRLLPFVPLIMGILGGLLLPVETIQEKLLLGGALGQLSALIYKLTTRTFAKKAKLLERIQQLAVESPLSSEEEAEEELTSKDEEGDFQ